MPIEVDNHIWVGVFACCFVAQYQERMREGYGPADDVTAERFVEEAEAVADAALEARMRIHAQRRTAVD